ncbi:carboxypeptidase-like regulatory domain-containing protein [Winogradskyella vidalii]|uniref:carboxypeptidase-like regulatory domain-containing protein n=1 Tax=Winogradskyella vidalii TaxID=2615024 RepID=UPI0015C7F7E2|nr:carboxypeptidase-like regulatory domain-containing protein [Winogradskyella vidalii]
MKKINKAGIFIFLLPLFCVSQTFKGRVLDKVTQQPLETVAVYFDNTTIGTTTNEKGAFSIPYTDAVQSTLVISYLGYENVMILNYRNQNNITIELVEAESALDEVHLNYDDGLTRRQKLRLFRKEFLGASKFGRSSKILNEDDLVLRYNKQNKALYASCNAVIKIENKALQYEILYDLKDFEINFRYVEADQNIFTINSVAYSGTSYYKNLKKSNHKKTIKNRETAYNGSVQHFMRSLYNTNLKAENYRIFYDGFVVDEWTYFNVEVIANSDFKKVTLKDKVSILYNKDFQSDLIIELDEFFIDVYGNYAPVVGIYFNGVMGSQRLGDTLPLDYKLEEKE